MNERTDARMGPLSESLPLVPFLIPPIAGATAWVLFSRRARASSTTGSATCSAGSASSNSTGPLNIYSFPGLLLVYTVYQVPYAFMLITAGLRNIDPALEEASRVSGAGAAPDAPTVTLPAVMPSIAGAVLLMAWSGFGLVSIPLVIGTGANIHVLSEQIVRVLADFPPDEGVAIGLSAIMIAFVAAAWLAQVLVLRRGRFATIAGKGRRATPIRLGAWRWPVRGLVLLYMGVTTVLPLFALVIVSLEGFWTPQIPWGDLEPGRVPGRRVQRAHCAEGADRQPRARARRRDRGRAGGSASCRSSSSARRRGSARVVDGAIKFPATLSHIVLAVGFVLALGGEPFNLSGTILILMLAYLALYFPQTAVAADSAVGAGRARTTRGIARRGRRRGPDLRRVYLPLMASGLAAGWALLFVRCVGDLTASSILAGTREPRRRLEDPPGVQRRTLLRDGGALRPARAHLGDRRGHGPHPREESPPDAAPQPSWGGAARMSETATAPRALVRAARRRADRLRPAPREDLPSRGRVADTCDRRRRRSRCSPGEFVVLLGPSGCGKTTLLRCIAGLETPDAGDIEIRGRHRLLVGARDRRRRRSGGGIAMIFQSYALWPHMTAFQNVAYPCRGADEEEGDRRARRPTCSGSSASPSCSGSTRAS